MKEYQEKYVTNRKLATLPSGDEVYHYGKSVVVFFRGRRKILSTSLYNGGYREGLTAVFNHDGKPSPGASWTMLANDYVGHLRQIAENLGLDPDRATGMDTAADMECAAIETESYAGLSVSAIVTAGIEQNGGRVGDPADFCESPDKSGSPAAQADGNAEAQPHGTINIILAIDGDMSAGTLARALVTCTEAKAAALQELMADSRFSCGLATGSGTDQTIIVANADSPLCFSYAGKHAKLGELIGKATMRAVKKALEMQSGMTPALQHDALRRFRRFGVSAEKLYELYRENYAGGACPPLMESDNEDGDWQKGSIPIIIDFSSDDAALTAASKPQFFLAVDAVARDAAMLTYSSLYVHLIDQFVWGLLDAEEIKMAGQSILSHLAWRFILVTADAPIGELPTNKDEAIKAMVAAWENLFLQIIAVQLAAAPEADE